MCSPAAWPSFVCPSEIRTADVLPLECCDTGGASPRSLRKLTAAMFRCCGYTISSHRDLRNRRTTEKTVKQAGLDVNLEEFLDG